MGFNNHYPHRYISIFLRKYVKKVIKNVKCKRANLEFIALLYS